MEMPGDSPAGDRRPWGLLASLAWYVVVFEIAGRLYDLALNSSGLQAALDRHFATRQLGFSRPGPSLCSSRCWRRG